jgi:outer membrane lipoprotein-sorting protein
MKKISSPFAISRRALLAAAPVLAAFGLVPAPARAALTTADRADLKRVQDYLNGIHTLRSRFQQVAGNGGIATGTIYISRPGHMRVEYDPPVSILLVATGGRIWYYDKNLEQVSFFDLKDTPAWFLLQDNVTFGGDLTVDDLQHASEVVRVTVTETKNPDLGKATLILSDRPLELRKWHLVDAQQKTVTVTLDDPQYGLPLNPQLFYWTDPRPPNARDNG